MFTQAVGIDLLSTAALPFVLSNGRSSTLPAAGTVQVYQVTRLWSNAGTTVNSAVFGTSTVGYGLATQLTHL